MIFACDQCHFVFSRAVESEQCPDCGKYAVRPANEAEQQEYAVRPANEAEQQEYAEHLKEFREGSDE